MFIGVIPPYGILNYRTITNGELDDKDINYSRLRKFSKCCQEQVSLWVPWNLEEGWHRGSSTPFRYCSQAFRLADVFGSQSSYLQRPILGSKRCLFSIPPSLSLSLSPFSPNFFTSFLKKGLEKLLNQIISFL